MIAPTEYLESPSTYFLSCELSNEKIASRVADLMGSDSSESQFLLQYAESLEKAAEMDDFSLVRTSREAEKFESEFRKFVAEFPGSIDVALSEGEVANAGLTLARMEPELRREILLQWAETIRRKARK